MKILLLHDVYKLGRAGDVKKVADGYGRNYLIPQGLATLATPGAIKQAEKIRAKAEIKRAVLNKEMSGIAEIMKNITLDFSMRAANETDKLYGSVSTQMIADAIKEKTGVEINRRQIDCQPIRNLGEYKIPIRLTMDLAPEITVRVFREGEAPPPAKTPTTSSSTEVKAEGENAAVGLSVAAPETPGA